MKKIIADELNKGFNNKNIFYFSFDEFSDIRLMDLLTLYEKISQKKYMPSEGMYFLILFKTKN